jgi:hypothetical protein
MSPTPQPAPGLSIGAAAAAAAVDDDDDSEPEDPDMADEAPTPAPALVTELLPGADDGEESEPEDLDLLEEGREEEEDPQLSEPPPSAVAAPAADISGALDVEQPVAPAPQMAAAPNGVTARERRAARAQRLAELSAEDGEYVAPEPWPDGDGDPEGRFSVRVRIVGNRGQPSWRGQPDAMDAACALEDGGGSSTQWETVTVRGVRLVSRAQMKFDAGARAEQQERLAAEEAAAEAEAARVAEHERLAAEEAAAEAERARLAAEAKAARLAREEEAARRRREETMVTLLQAVIRGRREWRGHRDRRQAALVIEAAVRRWGARAAYAGLRGAVMLAQRWQRGRR